MLELALKQLNTHQQETLAKQVQFSFENNSQTYAELKDHLAKAKENVNDLQSTVQALEDQIFPLKSKLKTLQEFVSSRQNDAIMCELAEKRAVVKELDALSGQYIQRIQAQTEHLQKMSEELLQAKRDNAAAKTELKGVMSAHGQLKQEFGFLKDSYTDALTKLHENLDKNKTLTEAYRQLGVENEDLKIRAATAFYEMTPRVNYGPVRPRQIFDELELKVPIRISSEDKLNEIIHSIKALKSQRNKPLRMVKKVATARRLG